MSVLGIYLVLLLLGLFLKAQNPQSKVLIYFRAFLPSWRFFETPGEPLRLEVRSRQKNQWHQVPFQIHRPAWGFCFNSTASEIMSQRNLLEHLVQDLEISAEALESRASFQLVRRLALLSLLKQEPVFTQFQFRILMGSNEEILQTEWCSR